MNPLLELQNGGYASISNGFLDAPHWRIEGWQLSIHEHSEWLIDGPSGSGKSLLLRRCCQAPLSGLEACGTLLWRGQPAPQSGALWRHWIHSNIRLVPQEAQSVLSPCLTIGEQLRNAHIATPFSANRTSFDAILNDFQLPDWASLAPCFPSQLSGGQRQRVALILALLAQPQLLLLDEPSSALHGSLAQELPELVHRYAPHATKVWTTHDPMLRAALIARRVNVTTVRGTLDRAPCSSEEFRITFQQPSSIPQPFVLDTLSSCSPIAKEPEKSSISTAVSRCIARLEEVKVSCSPTYEIGAFNKTLEAGRIIGWWGPSGVGKTSLARVLVGLRPPLSGTIARNTPQTCGDRRSFLAFQNSYACFAPHLTLGQQLQQALQPRGHCTDQEKTRIQDLIHDFGLPVQTLDAFPHQLSGGELQRCALIRGILICPELLILDEPTSALDATTRLVVTRALRTFAQQNSSTLCVISHDYTWLESIADEIWDLASPSCQLPDTSNESASP